MILTNPHLMSLDKVASFKAAWPESIEKPGKYQEQAETLAVSCRNKPETRGTGCVHWSTPSPAYRAAVDRQRRRLQPGHGHPKDLQSHRQPKKETDKN